jgi:hypothetical protein
MPTVQSLFRLLSEFIVLLLGGLLILIALTRRVGLPAKPGALELLAVVFIYWAVRAWMRRGKNELRLETQVRAGSLALVGLFVLAIPLLPLRYANLLLGLAGTVLVLRGLLEAFLAVRRK